MQLKLYKYHHYKGNEYDAIGETRYILEELVAYRSLHSDLAYLVFG